MRKGEESGNSLALVHWSSCDAVMWPKLDACHDHNGSSAMEHSIPTRRKLQCFPGKFVYHFDAEFKSRWSLKERHREIEDLKAIFKSRTISIFHLW